MTSTLQQQRTAGFDHWQVRPVFIVQVFTKNVSSLSASPRDWLRVVPGYRTQATKRHRKQVADDLRALRLNGITPSDVRRMALAVINAPQSYGGRLQSEARERVQSELRERLESTAQCE